VKISRNTVAMLSLLLLLSATLAVGQSAIPCPAGSNPSSAGVAGQNPSERTVTSASTTPAPPAGTAAPIPGSAAPRAGIATPSPRIAAPHPRVATSAPHAAAPKPMTASPQGNMSSAPAPKASSGITSTTASLGRRQPPCTPSSNGPEVGPAAPPPN
jgi:hypothetical protein